MKETADNTTMHAVYSLAFALLFCRSENEALKVMRYFAMPKSRITYCPEPSSGPDGHSTT